MPHQPLADNGGCPPEGYQGPDKERGKKCTNGWQTNIYNPRSSERKEEVKFLLRFYPRSSSTPKAESLSTANTQSDTRGKKWRGRRQSRVAGRSAGSTPIGWHSARSITCRRAAVCKEKLLLPLQHGKVATGLLFWRGGGRAIGLPSRL